MGIVEHDIAIFSNDGFDIEQVAAFRDETGSVNGYPGATCVPSNEGLTYKAADILIPAAMENAITTQNCENIDYKLIVEAANGPVTAEAEECLNRRGIEILPDLYVNAGGVVVSYFEWVKNITHLPFGLMDRRQNIRSGTAVVSAIEECTGRQLPEGQRTLIARDGREIDVVRSGLEEVMTEAFDDIMKRLKTLDKANIRTAAYVVTIARITEFYRAIGL